MGSPRKRLPIEDPSMPPDTSVPGLLNHASAYFFPAAEYARGAFFPDAHDPAPEVKFSIPPEETLEEGFVEDQTIRTQNDHLARA